MGTRRPAGRRRASNWAESTASPLLNVTVAVPTWPKRDECPGCAAGRDALGRLPVGFCGPDCLARKTRDELHERSGL